MYKKLLVLLLCGVMMIAMLASCVDENQGEDSSNGAFEEESNWVSPELEPNENIKGKDIYILTQTEMEMGSDEPNKSDPLEDAVYRRNDRIQNFYGVTLNPIVELDYLALSGKVKNDVSSGSGEYHIIYQHMVDAATNLGAGGNLYSLTELEYVNFDNPWWDQDCKNGFMFGDNMYVVCGDLLPTSMMLTAAMMFNKTQFDQHDLEYPYDDAREGTWTIDDMLQITKDQTRDLNGDGKMNYSDDFYGLAGWSMACDYNFWYGSGCTMFTFDEDHLPVYQPNTDRLQTVYDKIYELIITQQAFHVTVQEYLANNSMYAEPLNVFKAGRSLFFAGSLIDGTALREMENEFGVLPQPKYDEKQADYMGFVNGAAPTACVPNSLSDEALEDAGFMLEVLASSSYYMVTDTLYDKVAKSKNARDPESAEMVDVIIRHKVFDFGYTHLGDLPCGSIAQIALNSKSSVITRDIEKSENQTNRALKKIYSAYGYDY
ncbi:MAG: hypothetical protein II330_07000 [Clostridia bacterium]|nr:hypothetical protein [Clostridia bacterium]